ncbi:MAG: XdhC family protein [Chloroflexi bacterium]|nr:XdhC family protein [Chloroflexota bacterium]
MHEVFREAVELLKKGEPIVMATVVRTKGSTPQKPGSKLLVRKDGSGVGTLGGGCVEGDIWFAAKELMRSRGDAVHRDYYLNEDIAARDGLVCGGTMYFLIDPIYEPPDYLPYAQEVVRANEGSRPVALINLIKPAPGDNSSVGAKLFVRQDGTTKGTLGDPKLDAQAIEEAQELMALGKNRYVTTEDGAEYFIEAYTTPPTLVVAGGGHISKALAPLAKMLGFRLFVIDDRPRFANKERFPDAEEVIVAPYDQGIRQLPINANTFIVVATRGHNYDDVALEAAARTPASYVGLVGSKRKAILIYEQLLKHGIPLERVEAIHSPVGLDIGGRTPEEIAISIMAEILMFRFGGTGLSMKLEEHRILKIMNKVQAAPAIR